MAQAARDIEGLARLEPDRLAVLELEVDPALERVDELALADVVQPVGLVMPAVADITCARMRPLLAAVTPRSWYLRKLRRPSTLGAVSGVAWTSLPVGIAA